MISVWFKCQRHKLNPNREYSFHKRQNDWWLLFNWTEMQQSMIMSQWKFCSLKALKYPFIMTIPPTSILFVIKHRLIIVEIATKYSLIKSWWFLQSSNTYPSALAMELLQSYTEPLIWNFNKLYTHNKTQQNVKHSKKFYGILCICESEFEHHCFSGWLVSCVVTSWAPSQYKDRLICVWRFPC